ncbi:hypothetical protein T11_6904 [Trichinella zimbabwensis]|uniref:Uncharacterized protein n=1 Tax=Trichinella zimbabwensis TaxID=268475 RepID=A0A0V1GWZ7_9BILA|nr:hypothetical protein T11_6904 [Trichinella zimbabwensis]
MSLMGKMRSSSTRISNQLTAAIVSLRDQLAACQLAESSTRRLTRQAVEVRDDVTVVILTRNSIRYRSSASRYFCSFCGG